MAFGVGYFWWAFAFVGMVFVGKPFVAVVLLFFLILCLLHVTGIARWLDENT